MCVHHNTCPFNSLHGPCTDAAYMRSVGKTRRQVGHIRGMNVRHGSAWNAALCGCVRSWEKKAHSAKQDGNNLLWMLQVHTARCVCLASLCRKSLARVFRWFCLPQGQDSTQRECSRPEGWRLLTKLRAHKLGAPRRTRKSDTALAVLVCTLASYHPTAAACLSLPRAPTTESDKSGRGTTRARVVMDSSLKIKHTPCSKHSTPLYHRHWCALHRVKTATHKHENTQTPVQTVAVSYGDCCNMLPPPQRLPT